MPDPLNSTSTRSSPSAKTRWRGAVWAGPRTATTPSTWESYSRAASIRSASALVPGADRAARLDDPPLHRVAAQHVGDVAHQLVVVFPVAPRRHGHPLGCVEPSAPRYARSASVSRNFARTRPRVGPILPTGMSSAALISA